MPPADQYFQHLDLAKGGAGLLIPLNYRESVQAETLRLMLMSQSQGVTIGWQSGMDIFTDLSNSGNGVATLGLTANHDICGGRIKRGDPIYTMVCAVSPRMEQVAWNHVGRLYFSVLSQHPLVNFASIGDMPDTHPWVAGFAMPCTSMLGVKGQATLTSCVRLAAATLVNRCREVFVPNPNDSLLRDIHDPESEAGA